MVLSHDQTAIKDTFSDYDKTNRDTWAMMDINIWLHTGHAYVHLFLWRNPVEDLDAVIVYSN